MAIILVFWNLIASGILTGLYKQWLQTNRIDVCQVQRSVGVMKRIELEEVKELAPHRCERCGGLTRLIASEPHPDEAKTDLLTYSCMTCDEYSVVPNGTRAAILGWFRPPAFDPETVKLLSDAYDKAQVASRYRPDLQIVIMRWPEQLGPGGASEPAIKILRLQQDRHPVVHFGSQLISVRDYGRA